MELDKNHMENEQFITDGKEFFVAFESPLVTGYMPVPIPKGDPVLRWNGPKINLADQWYPALAFMHAYLDHEVILRLFMTQGRDKIIIYPLTQYYGTGMTVTEAVTKEEREEWASAGLTEAGTMHSHCNAGAFASSTDTKDELTRDGLHITIGKLKADQFDIHARMVWTVPGEEVDGKLVRASMTTCQKPYLLDWFELPEYVYNFIDQEPELEDSIVRYMLTKPYKGGFPKPWADKLIRRPVTQPGASVMQSWGRADHNYGQLSMADDIPPDAFKKKEEAQNDQRKSLSAQTLKDGLLWDLWSRFLETIADHPELRANQVAISEFDPITRPTLIRRFPAAGEVWDEMVRVFKANNVSEEEFFAQWGSPGRMPYGG